MRVLASYTCIKYGGFIFRIGCLGEKKNKHATCTIFSAFCRMTPCVTNVHGNHYTSTYFILSRLIVSFSATLSLRGWYFRKKNEYVSQHTMRVSTCLIHVQLAEWRTLVSDNIYSTGLVKAVGTCQCINFVNAGDLE